MRGDSRNLSSQERQCHKCRRTLLFLTENKDKVEVGSVLNLNLQTFINLQFAANVTFDLCKTYQQKKSTECKAKNKRASNVIIFINILVSSSEKRVQNRKRLKKRVKEKKKVEENLKKMKLIFMNSQ